MGIVCVCEEEEGERERSGFSGRVRRSKRRMIRLCVFDGAWLLLLLLVLAGLYPCNAKLDPDSEFLEQHGKKAFNNEDFTENNLIGLALMLVREAYFFTPTPYKRTGNMDQRWITLDEPVPSQTQTDDMESRRIKLDEPEQEETAGQKRQLSDPGEGRRDQKRMKIAYSETGQRVGQKRMKIAYSETGQRVGQKRGLNDLGEREGGQKRRRSGKRRSLVVVRGIVEFNLNDPEQIVGQKLKMRVGIVQRKNDAVTLTNLRDSYRAMNLSNYRLYGATLLSIDERKEYLRKLRQNIEHGTAKIQPLGKTELQEATIKIPVEVDEANLERLAVFFPSFNHQNREILDQPLLWYVVQGNRG